MPLRYFAPLPILRAVAAIFAADAADAALMSAILPAISCC